MSDVLTPHTLEFGQPPWLSPNLRSRLGNKKIIVNYRIKIFAHEERFRALVYSYLQTIINVKFM